MRLLRYARIDSIVTARECNDQRSLEFIIIIFPTNRLLRIARNDRTSLRGNATSITSLRGNKVTEAVSIIIREIASLRS